MLLMAWKTYCRPGELVLVVQPPGMLEQLNSPPGSTVGMASFENLPQIENLSLKRWSILIMSSRKFNSVRTGKNPAVVAAVVVPLNKGSLLKMSLMYAAAFGFH